MLSINPHFLYFSHGKQWLFVHSNTHMQPLPSSVLQPFQSYSLVDYLVNGFG